MKNIFIAGITGSIGTQAIDIIRAFNNSFQLAGFTFHSNVKSAEKIINEFNPEFIIATLESSFLSLKTKFPEKNIYFGINECTKIIENQHFDIVLNAIVGAAGLPVTYSTVKNQKRLALANKESLVTAGEIIMPYAKKCEIIPVDSEHSAIFQCIQGENNNNIKKLWLTASGGPFLNSKKDFKDILPEEALKHPNWDMGAKISIDSATMMNKGLEVIEAYHLFNVDYENIFITVHPESIIHSMVEFTDGSFKAQLGATNMKGPIQLSFTYPERFPMKTYDFDIFKISKLNLLKPDFKKFSCLNLAFNAGKNGTSHCIALNASNEAAVEAFLKKHISFNQIPVVIEKAIEKYGDIKYSSIEHIITEHKNIYNCVKDSII
ncbi:MAG: 1-deoxy-D-xylulose-5-phosphate reductoisomerase [Candidatus Muirbacterium halophilum]|nr:1-deoxy-D-xylulose-5-phosphate reductoisomerase [Candidatus Muirbacterium halophilum]